MAQYGRHFWRKLYKYKFFFEEIVIRNNSFKNPTEAFIAGFFNLEKDTLRMFQEKSVRL